MAKQKIAYEHYYKVGQQVKVGIRLSGKLLRESNGEITSVDGNYVTVEVLGGGLPTRSSEGKSDSRVLLSGWSGWGFYCCEAILEESGDRKDLLLTLVGAVEEKQRREYFRLDAMIPFVFDGPDTQQAGAAKERWNASLVRNMKSPPPKMFPSGKGYRAVTHDGKDLPPDAVNLSGGGMKVRTHSGIRIGNLVNVDLYLPLPSPRIVSTVAEVLRCNEVTLRIEKEPVFIVALKFIHIDEKDREAVISYIFTEQRNQLKTETERELR
jgi:ribosome maturation factor RimP